MEEKIFPISSHAMKPARKKKEVEEEPDEVAEHKDIHLGSSSSSVAQVCSPSFRSIFLHTDAAHCIRFKLKIACARTRQ